MSHRPKSVTENCGRLKHALNTENSDFMKLRSHLDDVCSQIATRFGSFNSSRKLLKSTIIDILVGSTCLACVARKLSDRSGGSNVDPLFRERRRLAINLLVEELHNHLSKMGCTVVVSTETRKGCRKVDLVITLTNYGIDLRSNTRELMVQVKTGISLSLFQLLRYLLDKQSNTIVVWRIRMHQVLVFDFPDVESLLIEFMKTCIVRANRLLSSSEESLNCKHVYRSNWQQTQEELQNTFQKFAKTVTETLPYIVHAVLDRLDIRDEHLSKLPSG